LIKLLLNKIIINILVFIIIISNLWLFICSRQKYNISFLFVIIAILICLSAIKSPKEKLALFGIIILSYISLVQVLRSIFSFSDLLNIICITPIIIFNIWFIFYFVKNKYKYYN
jgi:hypothetical protein